MVGRLPKPDRVMGLGWGFMGSTHHAKALNPLCPLSTLLSHTGTKSIACKIRGRFISVETEVLLANLITLSQIIQLGQLGTQTSLVPVGQTGSRNSSNCWCCPSLNFML